MSSNEETQESETNGGAEPVQRQPVVRRAGKRAVFTVTHLLGRLRRSYYFEDYVRVYPGGIAYNRFGLRRRARPHDLKNLRNHMKFYEFVSQFVPDQRVIDVGCGSGYGCKVLSEAGAAEVHGTDVSRHALRFARKNFAEHANFTRQTITDLDSYRDNFGDVVISSEVLEHIKEYRLEGRALDELRRITRPGGLLVVATPNSELLGEHGFSWEEISSLFASQFDEFCIFENALVPFEPTARRAWEERVANGQTGVVVSERIDLQETTGIPAGVTPETKDGQSPGVLDFAGRPIDTGRLHNTHSWIVLAVPR